MVEIPIVIELSSMKMISDASAYNVLRSIIHENPPNPKAMATYIVNDALATAMHAMRTTIETSS